MKILALSRYGPLGASSRLRMYQFGPGLAGRGIDLVVEPFFEDDYLVSLYSGERNFETVLRSYVRRVGQSIRRRKPDVVWLEKEALPWVPWLMEGALLPRSIPLVADYDDAVFHRYDSHASRIVRMFLGKKIDAVMARADLVLAGNAYLAARARAAGAGQVEIFPTVVDIERYRKANTGSGNRIVVGWIGSPSTASYLDGLTPVFRELASVCDVDFVAIGARQDQLDGAIVSAQPWSEHTEVDQLCGFDIGIMPLPDAPWERGKCGYKIIQYMACGLPVIASPVGVNTDIVIHGETGFLASSNSDWREAIAWLAGDSRLRARMGAAGRARAERDYSLQAMLPRLETVFRNVTV